MSSVPRPSRARPKYYDLNLLNLPAAGMVSILHRITGIALLLFLVPGLLCLVQLTLQSEAGFNEWKESFSRPVVKVVFLAFTWAYLHHFFAGIRYLLLDIHVGIAREPSRLSAILVLAAGVIATLLVGARIW